MTFTLGLLLATGVLAGLLISLVFPLRLLTFLAGGLSTLQIYTLPIGNVFFSASHLGGLGAWRVLGKQDVWSFGWYRAIAALVLIQALAMLWSPEPFLAFRQVIYWLPFLFVVPAVIEMSVRDRAFVEKIIRIALITSAIEAMLVIAFRVSPELEGMFLSSPISRLFISAKLLSEVGNGAYTVFDPGKAGGVFINANVASAFLGFSAMVAWGVARAFKSKLLLWIGVLDIAAVFFTGSKAGMALAVFFPALIFSRHVIRSGQVNIKFAAAACFLSAAIGLALYLGYEYFLESRYVANSEKTLSYRLAIWEFAWIVLQKNPFIGIGFGGWELDWPVFARSRGLNPFFPPHNSFIAIYAQSGLIAVTLGFIYCFSILRYLWRTLKVNDPEVKRLGEGLLCAVLWMLVQSQAENYGLIGEVHLTPLLATVLGYMVFRFRELNEK